MLSDSCNLSLSSKHDSFSSGTRKILCNFKLESIVTLSQCLNLSHVMCVKVTYCIMFYNCECIFLLLGHVIQIEVMWGFLGKESQSLVLGAYFVIKGKGISRM